jgi:hypothetical protein
MYEIQGKGVGEGLLTDAHENSVRAVNASVKIAHIPRHILE